MGKVVVTEFMTLDGVVGDRQLWQASLCSVCCSYEIC